MRSFENCCSTFSCLGFNYFTNCNVEEWQQRTIFFSRINFPSGRRGEFVNKISQSSIPQHTSITYNLYFCKHIVGCVSSRIIITRRKLLSRLPPHKIEIEMSIICNCVKRSCLRRVAKRREFLKINVDSSREATVRHISESEIEMRFKNHRAGLLT